MATARKTKKAAKVAKAPTPKKKSTQNFKVRAIKGPSGREIGKELIYKKPDVIAILHQCLDHWSFQYDGDEFIVHWGKLRRALGKLKYYARLGHSQHKAILQPTISYIEESMKLNLQMFQERKKEGLVSFADLWLLFTEGAQVAFEDHHVLQGGVVKGGDYNSWSGDFMLSIETVGTDGDKFYAKQKSSWTREYEGLRRIDTLPCIPITDELKSKLSERGERAVKYIKEAQYLSYEGDMIWRSWFGTRRYRATGRCMIDMRTFKMFNSDYGHDRYRDDDNTTSDTISPTDYWRLTPWLKGFSFTSKQWGEFNMDKLTSIQYDEKAFDRLVMPEKNIEGDIIDSKAMIKSLVEEGGTSFTDIISGKGGGCIFLLHGPPGTGKTLTAEAVAEILHRPLYSISVGELGTDTEAVEESLRRVLDVATIWNAVVLIDEADIFLEERTVRDVERNALVAIFLRLLEYYQGVLFLTTNRVEHFDKAFYSRISIGLNYEALGKDSRTKVWKNLLEAAGVNGLNAEELSDHDINGRQIKNSIRIAMALASADNRPVESKDIRQVIKLTGQFNLDLTGDKASSKIKVEG